MSQRRHSYNLRSKMNDEQLMLINQKLKTKIRVLENKTKEFRNKNSKLETELNIYKKKIRIFKRD